MPADLGYTFTLGASLNASFRGSMSAAQTQVAGLARRVRQLESTRTGRLGAGFESQRRQIAGLGRNLREAQGELQGLRARSQAAGSVSAGMARQIAQAERRVAGLTQNLRRSSEAYREQVARARTAEGSIRSLRQNYRGLSADIECARRSQAALSANLARRDALRDQRSDLRGRIVGTAAMGMAAAAPAALSIGFEDAMARVGALSNASREDLARLTAQARQLGRDTVFSASQAAEGMGYLAMAGFNTEQTLAAMPGMLNLAAAGNTDLGRTADIASNILSGFKMKASEMGYAADVLARTFTSSNTTLETLGETMKYVGPVAASVGLKIHDMAAATGLLGSVGIQGSQAGTALRAALLRLAAPPKMAKEALADLTGTAGPELDELYEQMEDVAGAQQILSELGMNTKDAQGNLRPMVDILEELNAKTRDMGTGERAEVFKKVFGTEASAAMIALADKAGQTEDEYGRKITYTDEEGVVRETTALRKYMGELEHSGGTCDRIAQMMNATTGGALRRMRSAFEDLGISVGNIFLPTIAKGADFLGLMSVKISQLVERFPKLSGAVVHVGGGLVGLAVGSLVLGYAFNTVRTGLNMARGAMLLFSAAQTATAGTTRTLTLWQHASRLATMGWRDALTGGRAAVVGLAGRVAAFAGIQRGATLGTVAFTVAQKVMAAGSAIAGGALRVLGLAVRFALGPLGLVITALTLGVGLIIDNWDTVGPYFQGLWDGVVGIFRGAWDIIRGIVDKITGAVSWIGEQMDKVPVLSSAKSGLGKAWDWAFGDDEDEDKDKPKAVATTREEGRTAPSQEPQGHAQQTIPSALPLVSAAPASVRQQAHAPVGMEDKTKSAPDHARPVAVRTAPSQAPQGRAPQTATSPAQPAPLSAAPATVGQEARAAQTPVGLADKANVPRRAAAQKTEQRPRRASDTHVPHPEQLPALSGTSINMDMRFQVQGLDAATFKQKMNECRKDFEAIVRRVVDDMQHQKVRTAYAQ